MDEPTERRGNYGEALIFRNWRDEIHERVPDLSLAIRDVVESQILLVSQIASGDRSHRAIRLLYNQVVNDLLGLLDEVGEGSGRPSIRTARTLIEHAINMRTITEDLRTANRYIDHLELGRVLMQEQAIGAEFLNGNERKAFLHSLKKAAVGAKRTFDLAAKEHGKSFQRQWHPKSLRDRANQYELGELYENYQLASLVTHGSSGGIIGTFRTAEDGTPIHRTGQALELAPIAFVLGLKAYSAILDALERVIPDVDFDLYRRGLTRLIAIYPDYFRALKKIDDELWPTGPVMPPTAMLAIARNGKRKWWLHMISNAELWEVPEDPALPEFLASGIDQMVATWLADPERYFGERRWNTIAVPFVTVKPNPNKRIPDHALMMSPEEQEAEGQRVMMWPDSELDELAEGQ